MTQAWDDVIAERQRQVGEEGWTPEHDDQHDHGQMAGAALCYLAENIPHWARQQALSSYWPWEPAWWKPADHRRNLVKAGALILAEIERLDRLFAIDAPKREEVLRWCKPCRAVGMMHCAYPSECGQMKEYTARDLAAQADSWKAWIDDLPLPEGFQAGFEDLQDFITILARINAPKEQG